MSTRHQLCYNERRCRGVAQLVARTAGGREVASSSLVTPTIESTLKPTSWKPHGVGFCLFLLGFGAGRPSSGRPCKPGPSDAETTMSLGWLDVTSSSRGDAGVSLAIVFDSLVPPSIASRSSSISSTAPVALPSVRCSPSPVVVTSLTPTPHQTVAGSALSQ